MNCPKCGSKMTLLFVSAVCDVCDPPKSATKNNPNNNLSIGYDKTSLKDPYLTQNIKQASLTNGNGLSLSPGLHPPYALATPQTLPSISTTIASKTSDFKSFCLGNPFSKIWTSIGDDYNFLPINGIDMINYNTFLNSDIIALLDSSNGQEVFVIKEPGLTHIHWVTWIPSLPLSFVSRPLHEVVSLGINLKLPNIGGNVDSIIFIQNSSNPKNPLSPNYIP